MVRTIIFMLTKKLCVNNRNWGMPNMIIFNASKGHFLHLPTPLNILHLIINIFFDYTKLELSFFLISLVLGISFSRELSGKDPIITNSKKTCKRFECSEKRSGFIYATSFASSLLVCRFPYM